jgi:trimethylguanosine synthase
MGLPVVLEGNLPLTGACQHFYGPEEVPGDLKKYWHQRYNLFSGYDYDIHLTHDAWFGVTPEPVANTIAKELPGSTCRYRRQQASTPGSSDKTAGKKKRKAAEHDHDAGELEKQPGLVIDMFAGAGGNTIAFALSDQYEHVIGIEKDAATLACAQHNADVYGVEPGRITWVHGDSFEFLAMMKAQLGLQGSDGDNKAKVSGSDGSKARRKLRELIDTVDPANTVIFASPPWGGINYVDQDVFDLATMEPYSLRDLSRACLPLGHALFLPRTSDLRQISSLIDAAEEIDVVQYCVAGASKALVAYYPPTKA